MGASTFGRSTICGKIEYQTTATLAIAVSPPIVDHNAELEIEALTGVKVGHSTQQKLFLTQDIQLPQAKQAISEVSVDGSKVRLRGKPKAGCHWRDYKAVRLQGT